MNILKCLNFKRMNDYLSCGIFVLIISAILLPFAVLEEGNWLSGLSGKSIERTHWSLTLVYNSFKEICQSQKGRFFFIGIYILISTMSALALLLLSLRKKLSLSPQHERFRNCMLASLSFLMLFLIIPVGVFTIRYFHIGAFCVTCGWLLSYIYSIIQVIITLRTSFKEKKRKGVEKIPEKFWLTTDSIISGIYLLFPLVFIIIFGYLYFHSLEILNISIILLLLLAFFSPLVITWFFVKEMYVLQKSRAIVWIIAKGVLLAVLIFLLLFFFLNSQSMLPRQAYYQFILSFLAIAVLLSFLALL